MEHTEYKLVYRDRCPWDGRTCHHALAYEFHHMLKWLKEKNFPSRSNNEGIRHQSLGLHFANDKSLCTTSIFAFFI